MIPQSVRAHSRMRSAKVLQSLRNIADLHDITPSQVMRMYQESHTQTPVHPGKLTIKRKV